MSIFDEPKIDCHNHVFDPARFPYQEGNFYLPAGQELGTPAQFLHVLDAYGVQHALMVEPNSGYDSDNRCLLDTLARGQGRLKGIAVMPAGGSRGQLEELRAQGIVGIAFNPALFGVDYYAGAGRLLEWLGELGMFAQIQVQGDQLPAMQPLLEGCGARLLFDHCGRPDVAAGLDQPGFAALLELGRRGNAWVKLSGHVKFSRQSYPYADTWPFIHALVDAFGADRCLWGSDWPFLRAPERIDYGPLLTLFARLFPEDAVRRRILWENPAALFGFAPAPGN
jgi:predicted TIM-barrel fold metal-dependent hydrolase